MYIRRCGRVFLLIQCQDYCPNLKRPRKSLLAKNKIYLLNKKLNVLGATMLWHYVLNSIDSATFATNVAFRCIWVIESLPKRIYPAQGTNVLPFNMDYRNLYTTNLFRDIMIILVVNVGRVGIQTADYQNNGAGNVYASNFHHCDFGYWIAVSRRNGHFESDLSYHMYDGYGIDMLIVSIVSPSRV
jgi:hypothetical protein